jgi:endonuclease III
MSVAELLRRLDATYPDVKCALHYRSAYELTVAVILSAQCTDKMVNEVTPDLFAAYPTVAELAGADVGDVERLVFRTGFYRNKAKHLVGMAQRVVETYAGDIPEAFDDLVSLPGVARKTANVVIGEWYGRPNGVVVDTHVGRICRLLGLADAKSPDKVAETLEGILPRDHWIRFSLQLIDHGRAVCVARRPECGACALADLCPGAQDG